MLFVLGDHHAGPMSRLGSAAVICLAVLGLGAGTVLGIRIS